MDNIKYIVLDFDGTILNSNHEISSRLVEKLIGMQKKGYVLILCSGRSLYGILDIANRVQLSKYSGYIISYNGSQIYGYENNELKLLYKIAFKANEVADISKLVEGKLDILLTYCENCMGATKIDERVKRSAKIMGLDVSLNYIKDTPKILLLDTEENISKKSKEIREIIVKYDDSINVFSSVGHLLEITPKDAQKGKALEFLTELKGMSKSQMICFGDNENDLSMFKFCEYSVAMDNSIDIIKEISTHQTLSNNEDGVFVFLDKNFQ